MQKPRSVLAALALSLFACSPRRSPHTPSTPGHDDVARHDDDTEGEENVPGSGPIDASGNQRIRSFHDAKRALTQIYERHRTDLYCGCPFDALKVDLGTCGYVVAKDATRAGRIEWEHAVAAAAFGRTFKEWTEGDERCVDTKGRRYKGRKCAAKSAEFARMEGDLHNLFPVVGEVNGLRGDLPMGAADDRHKATKTAFRFGACGSEIIGGVFMPRPEVRGDVARAALYMDRAYPARKIIDDEHRAIFERWSTEDPPDAWERERNVAITERQGNSNPFIDSR